jgi:hypothetical protein
MTYNEQGERDEGQGESGDGSEQWLVLVISV